MKDTQRYCCIQNTNWIPCANNAQDLFSSCKRKLAEIFAKNARNGSPVLDENERADQPLPIRVADAAGCGGKRTDVHLKLDSKYQQHLVAIN